MAGSQPIQRGRQALALARAAELGRKAAQLKAMRATLIQGDDRPDCPIIARLAE